RLYLTQAKAMLLRIFFVVPESFPHLTQKNQKSLFFGFIFPEACILSIALFIIFANDNINNDKFGGCHSSASWNPLLAITRLIS
ncbi:MAG: hypothetical protein AAB116_26330, partial [Candidatus Poribacteria bacterium]